ncbi:hypothetical protein P4C99_12935 [Pontiellaceae bacterium B1224]|nr:hypothetical protein [Pontiellaceae bacterium B1224]
MKRTLIKIGIQAAIIGVIYFILLHGLSGTSIVAGVLCPGPHLPHHYPILIGLFILCRLYIVLLPGILLSRIGMAWLKKRHLSPTMMKQ